MGWPNAARGHLPQAGPYTRSSASSASAAKTAAAIMNQMLPSRRRMLCKSTQVQFQRMKITASTGQMEHLRDGIFSGAAGQD
jgi:hypothetical protein